MISEEELINYVIEEAKKDGIELSKETLKRVFDLEMKFLQQEGVVELHE